MVDPIAAMLVVTVELQDAAQLVTTPVPVSVAPLI